RHVLLIAQEMASSLITDRRYHVYFFHIHIKKFGNLGQDSGRKFNLIIPKCWMICYNISSYQTLFVG
ncbi:MAG: hypothetical protein K1W35_24470, partial [Lachnospiraceae bacterium]